MRLDVSSALLITFAILAAGMVSIAQESMTIRNPSDCPPVLRNTFPKTSEMLARVNSQATTLGLAGWPSVAPEQLIYAPIEKPCFSDPALDRVWCPRVAFWNLSKDGLRFNAVLLMHDLNPKPKAFSSDLDYYEAVYIQDAFGNAKLTRIGVRIHYLYRASWFLKSPEGFPKFIGTGDTFEFEDTHDESGVPSRYVYNPQMGLAIAGMRLESEAEHIAALKAEEGNEEMGDSPGHAGECSGLFLEKIKSWREFDGFLWVESGGKKFVFSLSGLPSSRRKLLGKSTK